MSDKTPLRPSVGETLVQFLQSVGQRSEAELYLRVFRGVPRGRFAFIVPTLSVLEESMGTLSEQVAFLRDLGLFPSIVLGVTARAEAGLAQDLAEALKEAGAPSEVIAVGAEDAYERAERALAKERLPLFTLSTTGFSQLEALATHMRPKKIVVLRLVGGLGPHQMARFELTPGHFLDARKTGLGVISLRSDLEALANSNVLTEDELQWLRRCRGLLDALAGERTTLTTVSFASPLSLLRELFTVRGDGTLVKLGAPIVAYDGYQELDRERLEDLLKKSFQRRVRPDFWDRAPERVLLERGYRGVAILEHGARGSFLSKFAVLPVARGEGLGQDLWWAVAKETPRVYWRARPDNPINAWYATVCDGMHRGDLWHVFWRGIEASQIAEIIADAEARPKDFE